MKLPIFRKLLEFFDRHLAGFEVRKLNKSQIVLIWKNSFMQPGESRSSRCRWIDITNESLERGLINYIQYEVTQVRWKHAPKGLLPLKEVLNEAKDYYQLTSRQFKSLEERF